MKSFHKYNEWLAKFEAVNDLALAHRKRFGECPAIGMTMQDLYAVYRQTSGQLGHIAGGGVEPLNYSFMSPAGLTTVFEDSECDGIENTFSVEEPDAE